MGKWNEKKIDIACSMQIHLATRLCYRDKAMPCLYPKNLPLLQSIAPTTMKVFLTNLACQSGRDFESHPD
jgi:hypothetical protein